MTLRLMVVADEPLSASALRHALRAVSGFEVVDGYADAAASCSATMTVHTPDVVVVDQLRSRPTTLMRIGEIRAELPAAKIILLHDTKEAGWLTAAVAAGADAAIAKSFHVQGIGALVREIAAGNVFHAFGPAQVIPRSNMGFDLSRLTERELEILRLVAAGAPNGRIAAQLWVTEQTVKFHLSNVYRKLGVANRTQASHVAHITGLLNPVSPTPLRIETAA
jgi:DNA-binding NarL/FixJ family response regulator